MGELEQDDFSLITHQRIWDCMRVLSSRGSEIDRVLVAKELMKRGQLNSIGGIGYLVSMDDQLPKVYAIDEYLILLRDKAILRRAARKAQELILACCERGAERATVAAAARFYQQLSSEDKKGGLLSIEQMVEVAGGVGQILNPGLARGAVPSPWSNLNNTITAFTPGELIILAARPSVGKSAAAGQIALVAVKRNIRVVWFSLEMRATEIIQRLVCVETGLSLQEMRAGQLSDDEVASAQIALERIHKTPLLIDHSTTSTPSAQFAALQRLTADGTPPGLVIIDYLQLMRTARQMDKRVEEISEISRALKLMAREFDVPILALSQLNREIAKSGGQPDLHHLRDSGSLEQDADTVLFLHVDRDAEKSSIRTGNPCPISILIRKQRNGPKGKAELQFNPRSVRFQMITEDGDDETI